MTCIRQYDAGRGLPKCIRQYDAGRGLPKCSALTGPLAFTSIYIAPKFKIQYNTNWGEYMSVCLCTLLLRSVYCLYTLP